MLTKGVLSAGGTVQHSLPVLTNKKRTMLPQDVTLPKLLHQNLNYEDSPKSLVELKQHAILSILAIQKRAKH